MCVLIGTASVEINIERIKGRVLKGGHDIQEKDQRRRYSRTLENMRNLLPMSDFAIVLDNSTDAGHILVGYGPAHDMRWNRPLPSWAEAICS